jgi:endoglycosylceramidase
MTHGTQIVFGNGTIVILRGVNLSGYEYVAPIQWAHYESDYATIASWGFNAVRLPISWENIEPQAGVYNDSYLQKVDQDVAWAEQYGIYVVLDMHQMCWSSQFASCNGRFSAGFPKWAVSGYSDNDTGMQLMIHAFFYGLGPNGTAPSPSNPSMQQRFFAVWKYVASRYRDDSAIAGYDVLNEPTANFNNWWVDHMFPSTILPSFYTNVIDAIRSVDPYHICLWEGEDNVSDPTSIVPPRPNIVYSPHYPQSSMYSYDGTSARAIVQQIVSLSQKWNVPVFIGEWGMLADAPGVVQYINDSLSLYDTYSFSAAWWDYAKTTWPMDLYNPDGTPRHPLLENLVRPFVRQVSSPVTLSTTYNGLIQTFRIGGMTVPTQILISIPLGYSAKSIQMNAGPFLIWTFSAQGLLLHLPVTTSEVAVQYSLQADFIHNSEPGPTFPWP